MMESNRDIAAGGDDGLEKELQLVEEQITYKMFRNSQKCINSYQFIISLSCSYMFRQLCAILRELVCTF
jgi:hypothetical protein